MVEISCQLRFREMSLKYRIGLVYNSKNCAIINYAAKLFA